MRYYEYVPVGHIEDFDAFRSLDDLKAYCDRTGREYEARSNGNVIVRRDYREGRGLSRIYDRVYFHSSNANSPSLVDGGYFGGRGSLLLEENSGKPEIDAALRDRFPGRDAHLVKIASDRVAFTVSLDGDSYKIAVSTAEGHWPGYEVKLNGKWVEGTHSRGEHLLDEDLGDDLSGILKCVYAPQRDFYPRRNP